jgi:dTDP-4-amino-4,6-dideoxygalactose transaminase
VIEDAAQGLGGTQSGKPLGTRADVGIFSLGRGKNITCGAGGIIVTDVTEIAAEVRRLVDGLPASRVRDEIATLGGLALLCTFVSPRLYWFPSGLPFLRLGETIFHRDFPVGRISNVSASLLRNWAGRVQSANMARRATAARYCQEIAGAQHLGHGIPYLRFPMLVPAAARRRLLEDRDSRALGISPMYPATVAGISELSARFLGRSFPEAEYVASSLVTLPTHPLLSADDIAAVCRVVNAATESEITRRVDGDVGPPAVVGLRRTVGEQADTGRAAWVLHNRP